MPVIRTKSNIVVAYEHTPDDTHFRLHTQGPDGKFSGPLEPIEDYEAALAWAVEMADQMSHPIQLVPYHRMAAARQPEMEDALAALGDQERGELRAFMVSQLAQIMRDATDPEVRAEAHEVLVQMRVVKS